MDDLFGDEPEQPQEEQQEQAEQGQATDLADDLFGDEEITAPPSGQQQAIAPSFSSFLQDVPLSAEELKHRQELEYEEQYDPAQYAPLDQEMPGGSRRIADVMFMNLPRPASKGAFWHVKMPAFLRMDPQPFDEFTWNPLEEDEANTRGEENAKIQLPDENVIRWRWVKTPDGLSMYKQANARIVLWEDGSASLQLGTEYFDVTTNVDDTANPPLPGLKKLARPNILSLPFVSENKDKPQGLTYLLVEHGYSDGILQTQARISGTMAFTPSAINAKSHRKLANGVADRHVKVTRTIKMEVREDPEVEKARTEAAASAKRKAAQKEARKSAGGGGRRRKSMRSTRLDAYSDSDEEEDGYGSEEGGALPTFKKRNKMRYDEPEDIDDFVVPSDDEDGTGRVGKTTAQYDDEMDEIDAAAEKADRERRAKKNPDSAKAMDVDEPVDAPKRRLVIEGSDEE